jgi:hypothetical protein
MIQLDDFGNMLKFPMDVGLGMGQKTREVTAFSVSMEKQFPPIAFLTNFITEQYQTGNLFAIRAILQLAKIPPIIS